MCNCTVDKALRYMSSAIFRNVCKIVEKSLPHTLKDKELCYQQKVRSVG